MNETIYIVDDNELNLKLISAVLKSVGYNIITTPNAAEVLANIGTVRPTLAILNVMMPDMDGYELCRQLRARSDWHCFISGNREFHAI